MLSRNDNPLRATDESQNGGETPPPQTQEANKGTSKTYTQEELQAELSRVGAKEKREGKQAATKEILEALGVQNLDEVKLFLENKRKEEESKKSDLEKLQEELANKQKELLEAKQTAEKAESQRRLENRNAQIRNLLKDAFEPDSALLLFLNKFSDKVNGLLDENGAFDSKEAETLVNDFRSKNAYLFKGTGKGSPSNADGRLLKPTSEIEKEVKREVGKVARI